MKRLIGPLHPRVATALVVLSAPALLTGCAKTMTFPQPSAAVSYNQSEIQLTSGQFTAVVVVSDVQDSRPDQNAGSLAGVPFEAGQELRQFIRGELEGRLSTLGVPLAATTADAQGQSHLIRQVELNVRSTSFGGASSVFHKAVAGVNILVRVNDETGRPVFAQTYFGSADKYPTFGTAKQSGQLMADAVIQAVAKATQDRDFRAAIGL